MLTLLISTARSTSFKSFLRFIVDFNYEIVKALQLITGVAVRQWLTSYGIKYFTFFELGYDSYLSIVSAAIVTTFVLLVIRISSADSTHKIRSSLFEIMFDAVIGVSFVTFGSTVALNGVFGMFIEKLAASGIIWIMQMVGWVLAVLYGIDFVIAINYYINARNH